MYIINLNFDTCLFLKYTFLTRDGTVSLQIDRDLNKYVNFTNLISNIATKQ